MSLGKILHCVQNDRFKLSFILFNMFIGIINTIKNLAYRCVYVLCLYINKWANKVLYTGVTNNLERRLYEHKNKLFKGFTEKYNTNKLVYFDSTTDVVSAIEKEKQIKGWTRCKKIDLIESINPQWNDLSENWRNKLSYSKCSKETKV